MTISLKKALTRQHKNWLEVTGTAVNERHRTNGFKGSKKEADLSHDISKERKNEKR